MIKEYIKKNGKKAYLFQCYLGTDPMTGKRVKTTRRGFKTIKEAKLAMSQLQIDIEKNGFVRSDVISYEDAYKLWLEQHKYNVKLSTLENIEKRFRNQILPEFGHLRLDKIKTVYCQKIVNKWFENVVAYQQIKSYASKVFDFAILMGITNDNPFKRVIMPRKKEDSDDKFDNFYTKDQLKVFFDCLEKEGNLKDIAHMRILAFTGARRGEALALTWDDIDFKKKTVSFNKTLVQVYGQFQIQTPKTSASKRVISIDDITIQTLKRWRKQQKIDLLSMGKGKDGNPNNLIFTNLFGRHGNDHMYLTYASDIMDDLVEKYGIKRITTHGFRHTHASLLFETPNVEIKDVQERLGHSNIQTTMDIYTHVSPKRKETTALEFASYVNF